MVQAWGGPGPGYSWFDQEHGIYLDHNGFVWMGTSNGMHVMKFTKDGKHVLTIGEPGVNQGAATIPITWAARPTSTSSRRPTSCSSPMATSTSAWWSTTPAPASISRHWGAYGKRPTDTENYDYPVKVASPPQEYSTLHGLVGTKDGLIYVSDRRGNRIQVFRQNGEYLMEKFVRPETGGSGSGFSLQVSRDPEQSILYLMDGTNMRVWILRRKDLAILDRFGKPGRQAGEFIRAHMIAIDSQNRMYTGRSRQRPADAAMDSKGHAAGRVKRRRRASAAEAVARHSEPSARLTST